MERKVVFSNRWLPYVLLTPQLLVITIFFYLPAGQAVWMSTLLQDPLGHGP
jgi:sn-glycerol 3-phosphate transport system permease protein